MTMKEMLENLRGKSKKEIIAFLVKEKERVSKDSDTSILHNKYNI